MTIYKTAGVAILATCCFTDTEFANAIPLGKGKEADVILVDGSPAICIPSKSRSSFPVGRAMIYDGHTTGGVWAISLAPGAKPLTLMPGDCMSYTRIPDGYIPIATNENSLNPVLSLNKTYIFSIDTARTVESFFQTAFYSTSFCIKTGRTGALEIHRRQACVYNH